MDVLAKTITNMCKSSYRTCQTICEERPPDVKRPQFIFVQRDIFFKPACKDQSIILLMHC